MSRARGESRRGGVPPTGTDTTPSLPELESWTQGRGISVIVLRSYMVLFENVFKCHASFEATMKVQLLDKYLFRLSLIFQ